MNRKKQIEELKSKMSVLIETVNQLEWELRNPPKYKVGQKVNKYIISHVYRSRKWDVSYGFNWHWVYIAIKEGDKETTRIE